MEYEVTLTPQAIEQIQEAVFYISHTLFALETAKSWVNFLEKEIASLNTMPLRYPLTEEEPWHTLGIRKMLVKNFLVYYLVDENQRQVFVIALIYGRRDQMSALSNMPLS